MQAGDSNLYVYLPECIVNIQEKRETNYMYTKRENIIA